MHTVRQNNTTGCLGLYSHGFFFWLQGFSQKQQLFSQKQKSPKTAKQTLYFWETGMPILRAFPKAEPQKQAPQNGFWGNLHIKRQTHLSSRGKTPYPLSIFPQNGIWIENNALSQIILKLYTYPGCLLSLIFQGFLSPVSQNKNDLGMRIDSHFKVAYFFFILFLGLLRFAFGG